MRNESNPNGDPRQKLYFVNAPVDYALVGGLSLLTFVLLRLFYTDARTDAVITLGIQLSWICNWPHFAATSYRLYHSPDNVRQYPLTALLVPWVVLAGVLGSFASPQIIAPQFIKLVSIWSPYHYSGQALGISLLYARRAGYQVGKTERFALSSFIYSTFIAQTLRSEIGFQYLNNSGVNYPRFGLPAWVWMASKAWMILTGVLLAAVIFRWYWKTKRLPPPIILLPSLAQLVWFTPPAGNWLSFVEFVPFFHGMQYLLIAWSMQLKEKMDADNITPSLKYVLSESTRWSIGNFVAGACLFYFIPHLIAARYAMRVEFATVIVISGVQIHHFFVDGVIWKLKRKTVSSPLMVNLSEMLA